MDPNALYAPLATPRIGDGLGDAEIVSFPALGDALGDELSALATFEPELVAELADELPETSRTIVTSPL